MSTLSSFPATPSLFINADNVDDVDNTLLAHASDVGLWAVEGSAECENFEAVGATEADKLRANPYMKIGDDGEAEVAFDGVFNQLVSPNSDDLLNFIHTTGIFDLFLVIRPTSTGSNRRICGNSGGAPQQGIQVLQEIDGVSSTDGCLGVTLSNDTDFIVALNSSIQLTIGEWNFVLIRGTGTKLKVTKDLYHFESKDFTGTLGTGDAFDDFHLGSIADSMGTPNLFQGDMRMLALYSRNLTITECIAIKDALSAQMGVEL